MKKTNSGANMNELQKACSYFPGPAESGRSVREGGRDRTSQTPSFSGMPDTQ